MMKTISPVPAEQLTYSYQTTRAPFGARVV